MTDQSVTVAGERSVAAIPEGPGALLSAIIQMSRDPSVDVAKLEALLGMQERMERRQAEALFNQAFIRLQRRLPRIKKNGTLEYPINKNDQDGPKRKISNFTRYEDIDEAIRPLLDEEGFAVSFNTAPRSGDGGGLLVTCIIRHEGGHLTETVIPVPLDTSGGKNNLQGYGSTMKYGQRYALTAALNIISEGVDDDGVRGGMRFITDAQVGQIEALIRQSGSDRTAFLRWAGVDDLTEVQAKDYTALVNALNAKLAKAPKPASGGEFK